MYSNVGSACARKFYALFLVSQLFCSSASKILDIDEVTNVYDNSVYGENDVWSTLYQQCGKDTSYQCVENSVFSYLDRTLESDFVTDVVAFKHNDNNYTDICRRVKKDDPGDFNEREERKLEITGEETEFSEVIDKLEDIEGIRKKNARKGRFMGSSKSENEDSNQESEIKSKPIETKNIHDITDILYNRGVKYLMTHDMEFSVPSVVFGEGRIKISPQGFAEDGGALIKLNVIPDKPQEGRFFLKQIQKVFKKKLMTSMMAAVLIIKLLKLKAMFFLPLLLGVGTAKKILLKVLLFLFPALAHLFKLCSYYHHKHAKYHHHHHQISHHHHHVPVPVYTHAHTAPGELPAPYPASSYDVSGPGGYSHSRTETPGTLTDLASWGLGEYPASWDNPEVTEPPRYTYPTRSQPVAAPQAYPSQSYPSQVYSSQADLKRVSQYNVPAKAPTNVQYNQALASRLQALTPRPPSGYDPFYSPMLGRLESVFNQLGVIDEGCRERLVCSMYKNPARFTPHSNLVSAELSRDPSELQKPQTANTAAVRFYRYMAAARDGQEQKDCLRMYAACALATE